MSVLASGQKTTKSELFNFSYAMGKDSKMASAFAAAQASPTLKRLHIFCKSQSPTLHCSRDYLVLLSQRAT